MSSFNPSLRYQEPVALAGGLPLDFDALLRLSMEDLLRNTKNHQDAWLFGTEEQWNLDPGRGELVLSFPGRLVIAPAQMIGRVQCPNQTLDLELVRCFRARRANRPRFAGKTVWRTARHSPAHDRRMGRGRNRLLVHGGPGLPTLRLSGRLSWSRGKRAFLYHLRRSQAEPAARRSTGIAQELCSRICGEFRICAESFEDQRHACCRYFRRGALVGLSQSELIDSLALAAPSVLETAGYPPEAAERIMELVGGISDEEIQNS